MLLIAILATITVLLGASAVLLLWTSRRSRQDQRLMEVLASSAPELVLEGEHGLKKLIADIASAIKPITGLLAGNQEELSFRLALAGFRGESTRDEVVAARLLMPLAAIIAVSFTVKEDPFLYILMAGALGFFTPDIWLNYMVARRKEKISSGLADAIDLLVICMEAGLGMDQALIRVGQELRLSYPQLSDELLTINREQRAGKPRVEAWRSMAERLDMDVLRQLVSILIQTERFGTPVARSLGQFSETLRVQRMQRAEEMGAKTTVKMIFPLVLFIFPSIFVVLLGPALINIMRNFGN